MAKKKWRCKKWVVWWSNTMQKTQRRIDRANRKWLWQWFIDWLKTRLERLRKHVK